METNQSYLLLDLHFRHIRFKKTKKSDHILTSVIRLEKQIERYPQHCYYGLFIKHRVIQIWKTGEQKGKKKHEQLNGVMETSLHCVWHLYSQSEIHCCVFTSPHGQRSARSQVSTEVRWTPVCTHTDTYKCYCHHVHKTACAHASWHSHLSLHVCVHLSAGVHTDQGSPQLGTQAIKKLPFFCRNVHLTRRRAMLYYTITVKMEQAPTAEPTALCMSLGQRF